MVAGPRRGLIAPVALAAVLLSCSTDQVSKDRSALAPAAVTVSDLWPCPQRSIDVAIWLEPEITDAAAADIERRIRRSDGVEMACFVDRDATVGEFREVFADDPELLDTVDPEELPTSWRLRLTDPSDTELVDAEFEELPGVRSVAARTGGFQLALPEEPDEPDQPDGWPAHDLVVWIRADAAPAERSEVIARLTADAGVSSATTWTGKRNLHEALLVLDDPLDMLAGLGVADLPHPLFVTVAESAGVGAVADAFETLPGVRTVVVDADGTLDQ